MQEDQSISRREFLGKSALLASAAAAGVGARPLQAQKNSALGPLPSKLRVGFIGVGIRGTELLEACQPIHGVEVVAACDLYQGHLDRIRELTGGKVETCGHHEDLLARTDLDAVVIAVPDHWHRQALLDALSSGRHVYVEKPLTHKFEDGEALIKAVDKSGKVVQVGSQTISTQVVKIARELVQEGRIGKLMMVDAKMHRANSQSACYYPIPPDASPATVDWERFLGGAPKREFDPKRFFQWRLFWDYSGGLTTDLFVHLVTATHFITGAERPDSVSACSSIMLWKDYREVPDQVAALVSYPDFMLKLATTANNGHPGPEYTFYGTEGTIEILGGSVLLYEEPVRENFRYSTHSYATGTVEQLKAIMQLDDNLSPLGQSTARPAGPVEYSTDGSESSDTAHLRNFFEAVRGGAKPIEDIRTGVNAVNVGHMVNLSCRTQKFVRLNKQNLALETL